MPSVFKWVMATKIIPSEAAFFLDLQESEGG